MTDIGHNAGNVYYMYSFDELLESSSFRVQAAEKTRTEKKKIETEIKKEEKIGITIKVGIKNEKMTVRVVR